MDQAAWDNSSSERATSSSTLSGWRENPRSTRPLRDLSFVATRIKLSSPKIAPDKCLTIRLLFNSQMVGIEKKAHSRINDAEPQKRRVFLVVGDQSRFVIRPDGTKVLNQPGLVRPNFNKFD